MRDASLVQPPRRDRQPCRVPPIGTSRAGLRLIGADFTNFRETKHIGGTSCLIFGLQGAW